MTTGQLVYRRTVWDIILGVLLVAAGIYVLMYAVLATLVSLLVIGWIAVGTGFVLVVWAVFHVGKEGFWSAVLGGALLVVIGLFALRDPFMTAAIITLIAGALFLTGGIARIAIGVTIPKHKLAFVLSGLISVGLGLWVLLNVQQAELVLLGVLLGVQTILEGLTLLFSGRLRLPKESEQAEVPATT